MTDPFRRKAARVQDGEDLSTRIESPDRESRHRMRCRVRLQRAPSGHGKRNDHVCDKSTGSMWAARFAARRSGTYLAPELLT